MIPKETQDKIKANAKIYMHNEIKGMVGDEELQPHHLQYAHEAGATEWAGKVPGLVDALTEISESNCDYEIANYTKPVHSNSCRACKAEAALAKYKEVGNG